LLRYEAVQMVYQFKYIFKTDDDQLVTNIKFFDTIMSLLNRKYDDPDSIIHYGGHVVDVKQHIKANIIEFMMNCQKIC
jgi:hypothetical protein